MNIHDFARSRLWETIFFSTNPKCLRSVPARQWCCGRTKGHDAELLSRLSGKPVSSDLRQDILSYYADLEKPYATKRNPEKWEELIQKLDTLKSTPASRAENAVRRKPLACAKCGGPMAVVERFTAAQLQLRSPPLMLGAA